jgi:hypothetical protein
VNGQGATRDDLLEDLRSALIETLEMNRQAEKDAAGRDFEEVPISA